MIRHDLVWRLSLKDQWSDDRIFVAQFLFGHVYSASGERKASVAYIGCFVESIASLLDEIRAGLITGRTGSAFDTTEDDFVARIGFLTVIPVDTEVMRVVKTAFVIPVTEPVPSDFFRDRCWILAKISGDILKGIATVKGLLNVFTIFKSQMLLITGDVFTHDIAPSTAVRRSLQAYH